MERSTCRLCIAQKFPHFRAIHILISPVITLQMRSTFLGSMRLGNLPPRRSEVRLWTSNHSDNFTMLLYNHYRQNVTCWLT